MEYFLSEAIYISRDLTNHKEPRKLNARIIKEDVQRLNLSKVTIADIFHRLVKFQGRGLLINFYAFKK